MLSGRFCWCNLRIHCEEPLSQVVCNGFDSSLQMNTRYCRNMQWLLQETGWYIGCFDINVRTLFLPPYECNQLAFPHVDRSRYYLLFDIGTFPKYPLATFIGGLEVMKPLMIVSPPNLDFSCHSHFVTKGGYFFTKTGNSTVSRV